MNNNSIDDVGLLPHEYEMVIAPCLHIAAELAASRNDPTLFNDIGAMLTLRELIRAVSACYLEDVAVIAQHSSKAVFDNAPRAASAMVFLEFEVEKEHVPAMLLALESAEKMLGNEIKGHQSIIEQAYRDLKNDRYDRGMNALMTAGSLILANIDQWEKNR